MMSAADIGQAIKYFDSGDYNRCVGQLIEVMQTLLASRIEPVILVVLKQHPWPDAGIRLLRTESGLCLLLLKEVFNREDCQIWISYTESLRRSLSGRCPPRRTAASFIGELTADECSCAIPPPEFLEKSLLVLMVALRWVMTLQSDSAVKYGLLEMLVRAKFGIAGRLPLYHNYLLSQAGVIGFILHEPKNTALGLMVQHESFLAKNFAKRLRHSTSAKRDPAIRGVFVWHSLSAYQRYCHTDMSSRVLTTIHMGDFIGAFRRIAYESSSDRRVISLRREDPEGRNLNETVASHGYHQVLQHGQYDPIRIVAALRKTQHTLAVLFDLRDDFGETVEVMFFGQPARFVKGPAQLAILGRVKIIPFVCYDEGGVSVIEMSGAIDTSLLPAESLTEATVRVTQQLVCLAEKWIGRYPAQWKYLSSIARYFETRNAADIAVDPVPVPGPGRCRHPQSGVV